MEKKEEKTFENFLGGRGVSSSCKGSPSCGGLRFRIHNYFTDRVGVVDDDDHKDSDEEEDTISPQRRDSSLKPVSAWKKVRLSRGRRGRREKLDYRKIVILLQVVLLPSTRTGKGKISLRQHFGDTRSALLRVW